MLSQSMIVLLICLQELPWKLSSDCMCSPALSFQGHTYRRIGSSGGQIVTLMHQSMLITLDPHDAQALSAGILYLQPHMTRCKVQGSCPEVGILTCMPACAAMAPTAAALSPDSSATRMDISWSRRTTSALSGRSTSLKPSLPTTPRPSTPTYTTDSPACSSAAPLQIAAACSHDTYSTHGALQWYLLQEVFHIQQFACAQSCHGDVGR